MYRKMLILLFSLSFYSAEAQLSLLRTEVIYASQMDKHQWCLVNNLWCASFYQAYKDLPFDQVDCEIKNASKEALLEYLQNLFEKCRLLAIKNSSSLVLVYKDEQLAGYTLYHMLERQPMMHINHLAVDPSCQGQGIGKILLESTIKSTPEAIAVVLTTRILNRQAQVFYKKQGFYEVASIDGLKFDSRYSVLLRKDIKN
jgi:ribosomal protein S18 acetylase RimI-like enzyme